MMRRYMGHAQSKATRRKRRKNTARTGMPISSETQTALMDVALGEMFVCFLRSTGIRDKISEIIAEGPVDAIRDSPTGLGE
jgi:hypothetical protein